MVGTEEVHVASHTPAQAVIPAQHLTEHRHHVHAAHNKRRGGAVIDGKCVALPYMRHNTGRDSLFTDTQMHLP